MGRTKTLIIGCCLRLFFGRRDKINLTRVVTPENVLNALKAPFKILADDIQKYILLLFSEKIRLFLFPHKNENN